jgi:hypothetical protein
MFLDLVQNLSLLPIFAASVALTLLLTWATLFAVRRFWRRWAEAGEPATVKDVLVTVTSAMFALMMAFTAAGIWNDTLQARNAVQREAQALENVLALATGFPEDVTKRVRDDIRSYSRLVVERDWPAMGHKLNMDDKAFVGTDRVLVDLIDLVAAEAEKGSPSPVALTALNQLFEARSARLLRLTLSDSGVSNAQWISMVLLFACALVLTAIVHNQNHRGQLIATHLYALASAAAFFVVLAHDRPFAGGIAIKPTPLLLLAAKTDAAGGPTSGIAGMPAPR